MPEAPPSPLPPANSRSCAQNAVGNLTSDDYSESQWDSFKVGVEAVIQIVAYATDVTPEQLTAVQTAVAAEVGIDLGGVTVEVTSGFNQYSHLWIRMMNLLAIPAEGTEIDQGQQVKSNLTAVLEDEEKAQAFLNRALGITVTDAEASADGTPAAAPEGSLVVDTVVVPPTVLCFPAAGAASSSGMSFGLPLFALVLLGNIAYFAWKKKKEMDAEAEDDGDKDDDDDDDEEEEEEEEEEEKPPDEGEQKGDGEDEADQADTVAGEMVNESDVDLVEFLNTQMTPGLDDSPDMKVNPVLMYVVERMKKEEKLKAEQQALLDGDGDEEKKVEKKADEPAADHKVSAIKRLGWSLSKDAAIAADGTKQLKNVEAFLSKSMDIDVRKTALVRATHAGERSHNALEVARMAKLHAMDKETENWKHEQNTHAAEVARAQLKMMKLKTKVAEEELPEEKEGGGEEGEEGGEAAGE